MSWSYASKTKHREKLMYWTHPPPCTHIHSTASVMAKVTLKWLVSLRTSCSWTSLISFTSPLLSFPRCFSKFPLHLAPSPSPSPRLSPHWHSCLPSSLRSSILLSASSVPCSLPAAQAFIWSMWTSLMTCGPLCVRSCVCEYACVKGADMCMCVSLCMCIWSADMCVCDGGTDRSVVLLLKFCRQLFTFEKGSDESYWVVRGGGGEVVRARWLWKTKVKKKEGKKRLQEKWRKAWRITNCWKVNMSNCTAVSYSPFCFFSVTSLWQTTLWNVLQKVEILQEE